MARRRRLLKLTALATAGLAGCLGGGGGAGDDPTPSPSPTPTPAGDGSMDDEDDGGTDTPATDSPTPTPTVDPADISFAAQDGEITTCGSTCRTFNYTVENTGSAPARKVKANIKVYTPNLEGDKVFDGDQLLGTIPAGESISTSKDVDPGAVDAGKIRTNDGNIGIRLTVKDQSGAKAEFTFDRNID